MCESRYASVGRPADTESKEVDALAMSPESEARWKYIIRREKTTAGRAAAAMENLRMQADRERWRTQESGWLGGDLGERRKDGRRASDGRYAVYLRGIRNVLWLFKARGLDRRRGIGSVG